MAFTLFLFFPFGDILGDVWARQETWDVHSGSLFFAKPEKRRRYQHEQKHNLTPADRSTSAFRVRI